MSLWDWIIESITGPRQTDVPAQPAREISRPHKTRAGIGILDPRTPPVQADAPAEPQGPPWYAPEGTAFLEPMPMANPGLSQDGLALEEALTSQLDINTLVLPSLPRVPEAVLRHLSRPDCSLRAIADLIAQDQVTATVVLRSANCALWGGLKVNSLLGAVTRLGTKALRTLMFSESLRAAGFCKQPHNRELGGLLWRRAVACGCIMRALAEFSKELEPEDAFAMGLLHDVGNVIVLHAVDNHEAYTRSAIDLETFEYLCYECHELFGELIAERWGLPPRLKALIQTHHRYPAEDDPLRNERLHLTLADMINQMIGHGPPATYDLLHSRPVQDLGLADKPVFVQFLQDLPTQVEQATNGF